MPVRTRIDALCRWRIGGGWAARLRGVAVVVESRLCGGEGMEFSLTKSGRSVGEGTRFGGDRQAVGKSSAEVMVES